MRFPRFVVLFLALCSAAGWAHAQQGSAPSISGRVEDAQDYSVVREATIELRTRQHALIDRIRTTRGGQFEFYRLEPDIYVILVSAEGYQDGRAEADVLTPTSSVFLNISLRREKEEGSAPSGEKVSVEELRIPRKARKAFKKAVRELEEKKRPERSLRYFRRAIKRYPRYVEAYVQLALAHLELDEVGEAIQVLEEATRVNPEDARALTLLGIAYRQAGELKKSLRALEEAVALDGYSGLAHIELGSTLFEMGNTEEAFLHAQRAHVLDSQIPAVHLLLFNLHLLKEDHQAALTELEDFLALNPRGAIVAQARRQRDELRKTLAAQAK